MVSPSDLKTQDIDAPLFKFWVPPDPFFWQTAIIFQEHFSTSVSSFSMPRTKVWFAPNCPLVFKPSRLPFSTSVTFSIVLSLDSLFSMKELSLSSTCTSFRAIVSSVPACHFLSFPFSSHVLHFVSIVVFLVRDFPFTFPFLPSAVSLVSIQISARTSCILSFMPFIPFINRSSYSAFSLSPFPRIAAPRSFYVVFPEYPFKSLSRQITHFMSFMTFQCPLKINNFIFIPRQHFVDAQVLLVKVENA